MSNLLHSHLEDFFLSSFLGIDYNPPAGTVHDGDKGGYRMGRFLGLVDAMFGGWIGWWIGDHAGFMTAYCVSVIGMGLDIISPNVLLHLFLNRPEEKKGILLIRSM